MTSVVTPTSPEPQDLRERFVTGGLRVLQEHGAGELTVRRVAKAASSTTMCLYTKFGGRTGLIEALYQRGFQLLSTALASTPAVADQTRRILDLGLAYRRFALANPALYALMFQRPLPDFDPPPALRRDSLDTTFPPLVAAVAEAQEQGTLPGSEATRTAHLLWCVMHGIVSLELTHTTPGPPPDGTPGNAQAPERVLLDGLRATLTGLRAPTTGAP